MLYAKPGKRERDKRDEINVQEGIEIFVSSLSYQQLTFSLLVTARDVCVVITPLSAVAFSLPVASAWHMCVLYTSSIRH